MHHLLILLCKADDERDALNEAESFMSDNLEHSLHGDWFQIKGGRWGEIWSEKTLNPVAPLADVYEIIKKNWLIDKPSALQEAQKAIAEFDFIQFNLPKSEHAGNYSIETYKMSGHAEAIYYLYNDYLYGGNVVWNIDEHTGEKLPPQDQLEGWWAIAVDYHT